MYATDPNERLKQKYEKENNLLNPSHVRETPERAKFLNKYFNNKDFAKTRAHNAAKFAEPLVSILKKMKTEYVMMALLAVLIGSFSGLHTYSAKEKAGIENQQKANIQIALSVLFGTLLGFGAGLATTVHSQRLVRKYDIERFYNRISVRLFNVLKKVYPGLQDNTLINYNPELSLLVTTMLMANMSEADTKKIQSLAIVLANKDNLENDEIQEYESGINEAFEIVKTALDKDQDLYYSIVQIYNGVVPKNFNLKAQNTK